jgi:hypothetical protein
MPDSTLSIKLRYQGADVDGGTMPIEEVVISLQGFAGAYGKAANELIPSSAHELRVSAIDKGSFELAIIAWISSGNAKDTIETIKTFGIAAKYVFTTVRDVIDAKKHIKAKPYQVAVEGSNNTVVVINADGVGLPVALEVIE